MIHTLKKNFSVLKEMIKISLHGQMVFRLDFFGPFFVDGSLFLIQILAFAAIYANVDPIGTWGRGEMILYIGTFALLNAVNMMMYFFGVNAIPYKVKSGELDLYLTKPVSPLFRLSLESFSPGSIPLIIMSVITIVFGVNLLPKKPDLSSIFAYLFWLLIMQVLYYDMEVIIRSVSLYVISMARLEQLEDAGLTLCMKLPGIAFYGIFKVFFYVILPYGIMATLPVQSLIGEMNGKLAALGIGVVLFFSIFTGIIWKRGLKRYNSASS